MTDKSKPTNRDQPPRQVKQALLFGLRCKCPACGEASLFAQFLKPAQQCAYCGQNFTGHQADDFPAYIVILLLGHILIPVMIEVNHALSVPLLWQAIIWPIFALVLALAMIQPVKGAVIGLQWAKRMHGFAG